MNYQDHIDPSLPVAIKVENASFEWVIGAQAESIKKDRKALVNATGEKASVSDSVDEFKITKLNLTVPRGKLVAIVGPVGSGKSSLLQGVSILFTRERFV
jgi:ATP-binding cassette, subfamily C (CFTR/MRP), member 1